MADRAPKDLLAYMSVGLEFTFLFGLPMAIGIWLDLRMDTMPGFTVLGSAIGFAIGLRRLIHHGRRLQRLGRENSQAHGRER